MLYSVCANEDFNTSVDINVRVNPRTNRKSLTCSISYWDKTAHETYKKDYPASKFGAVCHVYDMLCDRMIPAGEIKQTVENIK